MDDDDFSDDGFDELNETVLQELEIKAIESTQARLALTQQQSQRPPAYYHQPQQLAHLQPQRYQPPQPQLQQRQAPPQQPQQARQAHDSYDYGLDDDDLDDTEVFEEITQRPAGAIAANAETTRPIQPARLTANIANIAGPRAAYTRPPPQQSQFAPRPPLQQSQFVPRPPPQPSQFARHPPPRPSQFARQSLPIRPTHGVPPPKATHPATGNSKQDDNIIAALQARLSELESELTTAQGEAAIMRSKYDKAQTEREADIARLKKQAAEQTAKQERVIEEAKAAQRTANTELQFARQDLREGLGRARGKKHETGSTTPQKKNKTWGQPDGFDSLEAISTSPTKNHAALRRQNTASGAQSTTERTPTKGKRKRPAVDSPSFALEIQDAEDGFVRPKPVDPAFLPIRSANDLPYDFLRLVLEHNALSDQPPTFDLFSRYALPSEPTTTFAAMILQKLPRLGKPSEPLLLLADFAQMILDIWQRCLAERYHAPIYYLASLVRFTLDLNSVGVAPRIISTLIPVCTTTCRLVAQPRFNSVDGNLSAHPDNVIRQLCLDIDVTQILALLHLAALGCVVPKPIAPGDESEVDAAKPQFSPQVEFWRTIEPDFILMMLSPKHPERDWLATIGMLWSSVLAGSVGPIPTKVSMAGLSRGGAKRTEAEDLAEVSAGVISRVSSFLIEIPPWAPRGSLKELKVRFNALRTLKIFSSSPYGAVQIAHHEVAIPRVVTAWSWAIDRMYDVDGGLPRRKRTSKSKSKGTDANESTTSIDGGDAMDLVKPQDEEEDYESEDWSDTDERDEGVLLFVQLPKFILEATRILHMLITNPRTADVIGNITDKLSAYPGGAQRYFLTLARLTVQEDDLIMDASIPIETSELAGELLRMVVNMEDAEAIQEAFNVHMQ
ncbi:hypothetical protein QBC43DRAFT_323854 [Cladorrhinum sp. PSN259]|nr:hypothetical protein QBC43DRAFT_323854 [Cladorrhinum sp. PSN259]